jgi:16S rRNA (cytosine967-C5)-methyltransferase
LLERAAQVVSPGGSLVYSTCTVLREENELIVDRFLETHSNFQLVDPKTLPPTLASVLDERGLMRCHPHINDSDGFFAARLERKN